MGAAAVGLLLIRPDVHETFQHVEWSVLIFFSGLFVMVGGLEAAGVLEALAERLHSVAGVKPILLGVLLIWAVALLSAVVDNIPITIAHPGHRWPGIVRRRDRASLVGARLRRGTRRQRHDHRLVGQRRRGQPLRTLRSARHLPRVDAGRHPDAAGDLCGRQCGLRGPLLRRDDALTGERLQSSIRMSERVGDRWAGVWRLQGKVLTTLVGAAGLEPATGRL